MQPAARNLLPSNTTRWPTSLSSSSSLPWDKRLQDFFDSIARQLLLFPWPVTLLLVCVDATSQKHKVFNGADIRLFIPSPFPLLAFCFWLCQFCVFCFFISCRLVYIYFGHFKGLRKSDPVSLLYLGHVFCQNQAFILLFEKCAIISLKSNASTFISVNLN